jgi:hypothetical protein
MTDALEQFEEHMAHQRLRFYDGEAQQMPPMVSIYMNARGPGGLPPTQDLFVKLVVARAVDDEQGTRARAARTYPSLVRQHHFQVALRTRARFDGVHWVPSLDMNGIDLLVLHRGFALGVALSMRSDNAAFWAKVKAQRHPPLAGLHMVHLDVDLAQARRVGQFAVHPLSDVWTVQQAMDDLISDCADALAG